MILTERQIETINATRRVFKEKYPMDQETRCSFGSIPPQLHEDITSLARAESVSVGVIIAGLLAFWEAAKDEDLSCTN